MKNPHPLICISGADGSGKSTLVAALTRAIPQSRAVTIWDLMADPRTQPMFSSKGALQTFLGALGPESRTLFLTSCLKASMERAPTGIRVVDSYWYKYMASELALGAEPTRAAMLARIFERPTITFRIALAAEVAAERKRGNFSPYECGLKPPSREAFIEFQSRTAPVVRQLIEGDAHPVVTLDGTAPTEELVAQVIRSLEGVLS